MSSTAPVSRSWLLLTGPLCRIGEHVLFSVQRTGMLGIFLSAALSRALTPPYSVRTILKQVHFIGVRSWPVIVVAGAFVGMVVALQFHDTLVRFGSVSLLGSAVGLSLIRELGPVLTALMVIGRAGSAMCAEIGIMRSEEQIDALECMSIDPIRYLIVPKLIATVLSVPLLTALFDVVGIAGGLLVGVVGFGVSSGAYLEGMAESVLFTDVLMGLVKSLVFGLLIVWISCAKGFFLHREKQAAFGAEGVSRVTTSAVVLASIAVLFCDYLISAVML